MTNLIRRGKIKFEKPGKYRIVVQGRLDDSWSDRLAGMTISTSNLENDKPTTLLIGHLRDQAQLSGVLNSLYELHLPILLVEYLGENNLAQEERWELNNSFPARSDKVDTRK
jgi:hypothetical protein